MLKIYYFVDLTLCPFRSNYFRLVRNTKSYKFTMKFVTPLTKCNVRWWKALSTDLPLSLLGL